MDTLTAATELSYDDNVAYEEQLPTEAEQAASLAKRIGTSKVYLLAESATSSHKKRKHHDEDEEVERIEEDDEMELDPSYRSNAILLNGTPISHLPTARIFAYAEHFKVRPMGLEWVDDSNCVLVFEYRKDARDGFARLQKSPSDEPDIDEMLAARPFPLALWPPEERINSTIGKSEGLKGPLRMRWARVDDVKKKNAMQMSKFYKRHGTSAGKELFNGRDLPAAKRVRRDDRDLSDAARKAQLDDELDQFLAHSDSEREMDTPVEAADVEGDEPPASPPSKMRSDYIAKDGRSLLDRTSSLRLVSDDRPDLASRITAPLPRRTSRRGRNGDSLSDRIEESPSERLDWGPAPERRERRERGGRGLRNGDREGSERHESRRNGGSERPVRSAPRPKKTQQELDDELDAFLRG
ncbi:hypothetical protein D9619_001218 [Psilocybe cf. subviscida]|uniref:Chromatin target of PRMT1 protein C-terminal domain-containing protein n=1 Tax=Psilocybe cf. subviscida TaxID=2480587 RepID=A0A8H5BF06_9AGAR|nr:hypothetical protein D9619_001218 [Psilocybe cf. subviscida]